jgi:hypothetical protein
MSKLHNLASVSAALGVDLYGLIGTHDREIVLPPRKPEPSNEPLPCPCCQSGHLALVWVESSAGQPLLVVACADCGHCKESTGLTASQCRGKRDRQLRKTVVRRWNVERW